MISEDPYTPPAPGTAPPAFQSHKRYSYHQLTTALGDTAL